MIQQPQGIIFDFDGTILDSPRIGVEFCCQAARILKLPLPEGMRGQLRKLWGRPADELIHTCWPNANVEEFLREWERIEASQGVPMFSGMKEILTFLGEQYVLSILTSRQKQTLWRQFSDHNIGSFFRFVYALEDCPFPKPDPRSIDLLFHDYNRIGVKRNSLIYIGDSAGADYPLA